MATRKETGHVIYWILRRVAPKYFTIGVLCLIFGAFATWSGTRAAPAETALQSLSGVVDDVFTRCTRGHSCTHFVSLRTNDATYRVSLFNCRGAEHALAKGDALRVGFQQAGWSSRGGSAYAIERLGFPICTYAQASDVHKQFETGNYRCGVLVLAAGVVSLVAAFVVGAARGYR